MKLFTHTIRIAITAACMLALTANAQTVYTYSLDELGAPGAVAPGVTASILTRVNGLTSSNACPEGFISRDYSTSATYSVTGAAVELTLTPGAGITMTLTAITTDLRRGNNGPEIWKLAYSTDGGASWVTSGDLTGIPDGSCFTFSTYSWNFTDIVSTTPVKFRFYGWDANNTSGIGGIRTTTIGGTACVLSLFYADADGDGYGNPAVSVSACTAPAGYVANNTDCNDSNASIKPGATEVCNGIDDNCNGSIDEGLTYITYYADADGDGYGNPAVSVTSCSGPPAGYVVNNTDCNDANASINPGATEVCNGIDDNCNGSIDEGLTFVTYYADADGDGYGDPTSTTTSCSGAPIGYVVDNTDCDDAFATVYPGATEICDGLDNDCDGNIDEDLVVATIAPAVSAITCKSFPLTFSTEPCAGCTYQWFKNDNPLPGATGFTYSTTKPAYYSVQVNIPGGCFDVSDYSLLISGFNPNANIYYPNGLNLCAPSPGTNILVKVGYLATNTYQWYQDGLPYLGGGATSWKIFPSAAGTYTCSITSIDGCNRVTADAVVINSCRLANESAATLAVYPNPASNNFTIDITIEENIETAQIQVVNMMGQVVANVNATVDGGLLNHTINATDLAAGMYLVKVTTESNEYSTQVVINK